MNNRKKKKDELANKDSDKLAATKEAPLVKTEETKGDAHDADIEELKRQLAEKSELAQGYFAQLQRVQADLENNQKSVAAERTEISDRACEAIVSGLLDTLDNFDRAISHLEKLPAEDAKGVLMVYETMLSYLKGSGLERISAAGCQFDPHMHDAIMQVESGETPDGTVLEEFQAGYSMKGKVIRPSKVKVAREKKIIEDNNIQKEE